MKALGADIPKIAVMPEKKADVLTLLLATVKAKEEISGPIITMSMAGPYQRRGFWLGTDLWNRGKGIRAGADGCEGAAAGTDTFA